MPETPKCKGCGNPFEHEDSCYQVKRGEVQYQADEDAEDFFLPDEGDVGYYCPSCMPTLPTPGTASHYQGGEAPSGEHPA